MTSIYTGYTDDPTEERRQANLIVAAKQGLEDDPQNDYWKNMVDSAMKKLGLVPCQVDYTQSRAIRQLQARANADITKLKTCASGREAKYLIAHILSAKRRISSIKEMKEETR